MICPKCGTPLTEGNGFCPSCGASVGTTYAQVTYPDEPIPTYPMKWFKFLIYFSLFFSAVMNAFTGIRMLTGSIYEGEADLVYATFSGMKTLDMIVGVLALIGAAICLFTRFRLSGYKKNGPLMVTVLYAFNIVFSLVYLIGICTILPAELLAYMGISSFIGDIVVAVVMIFVNRAYFKKREDMFIF